jgi:hypothetical protein
MKFKSKLVLGSRSLAEKFYTPRIRALAHSMGINTYLEQFY